MGAHESPGGLDLPGATASRAREPESHASMPLFPLRASLLADEREPALLPGFLRRDGRTGDEEPGAVSGGKRFDVLPGLVRLEAGVGEEQRRPVIGEPVDQVDENG